jgi:hypothetical protein
MQPLLLPQKNLWAGFTGTRDGLTEKQHKGLVDLLFLLVPRQVQHGDCVGADAELHNIALSLGLDIAIRPPIEQSHRAWCGPVPSPHIFTFPPKPYLRRDHDIVDHTNYLIGCPKTMHALLRSGTWATIRYAAKRDRVVYIVFPDGRLDRIEPDV